MKADFIFPFDDVVCLCIYMCVSSEFAEAQMVIVQEIHLQNVQKPFNEYRHPQNPRKSYMREHDMRTSPMAHKMNDII